jgi:hypothetical protein
VGPRTLEHLESQLAAQDIVLSDEVLDRIDEVVPPGVDLAPEDRFETPVPDARAPAPSRLTAHAHQRLDR